MILDYSINVVSPAKLNLFLHIIGRRKDGYHEIQTLFQLVEAGDELSFTTNTKGKIEIFGDNLGIPTEENLIFKAAKVLHRPGLGADIYLSKKIPSGAGLGGGSSNAATTLLVLNHIWGIGLNKSELINIGAKLGADVPVFVSGRTSFAEGIGEKLSAVDIPSRWYVIIFPNCHVDTGKIFSSKELTRNSARITMSAFLEGASRNDCQKTVTQLFKQVEEALKWLGKHGDSRLTGTGGAVFATFDSEKEARDVALSAPDYWWTICTRGINHSPLEEYLI